MSERKVLNKYYPPDFDPAAIPRRRVPRDQQVKVRLMTPFSMRCETCGDYIYKGKKFNARKEVAEGENYLGIKIFRFYIKCPKCAAEITFKTDPKNSDYLAEHGAVRNFEPWREDQVAGEEEKQEREAEEENDPMKALENRTLDSKREMDILDALDEIRTRNARNERLNAALQGHQIPGGEGSVAAAAAAAALEADEDPEALAFKLAAEEDEKLVAAIFHTADGDGDRVKRLADDEEFKLPSAAASAAVSPAFSVPSGQARKRKAAGPGIGKLGGIIIKKKKPAPPTPPAPARKAATQTPNLASLVGGYCSDNSDVSDTSESQSADGDRG